MVNKNYPNYEKDSHPSLPVVIRAILRKMHPYLGIKASLYYKRYTLVRALKVAYTNLGY